ncbi:Omega-conotoxin SVIB [Frankliniella fusca]|uniref:Omega-conotoxin SVIB n=1 Tax=Frankliniella fusca TaxID=407009 RepID=A0AAE1L6F4_9NEOP|nr:Omega-conotoxin SVIB [Frankliniella fusca]
MKTAAIIVVSAALVLLAACMEVAADAPEGLPHTLVKRGDPPRPIGPMPKPKPGTSWQFTNDPPRGAGQVHNPPGGASTSGRKRRPGGK